MRKYKYKKENNNAYTNIIQRLSSLRIEAGYSMRELSLILGYNPQFIKTIENQRVELKVCTLIDILLVLNISLIDFFALGDENENIISLINNLSSEGRDVVIKLIKKLK